MKPGTLLSLSLLFAGAFAACAQDVGDVDRTQPYRLKKSIFDGEWYLQRTVFDVPYSAGFTFSGETSAMERVRWQIEENVLIAYRSYDFVENTSAVNSLPDVELKGSPLAAYNIESHFDIVRDYNPQTGEETNVLLENTMDRPWYEREYIRVDWSKNLILNFEFIAEGVKQSPVNYFVQDRTDADRLLVGIKNGDGWTDSQDWREIAGFENADYIDLVDVLFADPETIAFDDGYGGYIEEPACWYYYGSADCQPSRLKIRSSFLRVDESESYEAMAYPDNEIARDADGNAFRDANGEPVRIPYFDKFGYFRIERDYFNDQRGRTQSGRTFLITRWGIWQDAPGCVDPSGSYRNCTVRPIVYNLSPGFPEHLVPAAAATVAQWNESFKEVVLHLKYGGTAPVGGVEDVFLLRPNSYVPGEVRGERIGDLRYSFLYNIPEPQSAGLLGYGPSAADPLTGRIVQATAYIYEAELEIYGTWGADVVDLLNGTIPPNEFIEGEDVREYVARAHGDYDQAATALTGTERLEHAREFARSRPVQKGRAKQKALGKNKFRINRSEVRARMSAIRDTPFEERLLNDEIIRALKPETRGQGSGLLATLNDQDRRRMSPTRWASTGAMREHIKQRRRKVMERNVYLAEFADPAVVGLAETLRGRPREEVRKAIIEEVFASTAEHEVGHTLGLRHNFAGSMDPLNYGREYWQLKGNNPAPFQPMTPEQQQGRMREHQYSSIMDYGSRFNNDIQGIGHYDHAAIKFGYGQLVEVFNDQSRPSDPIGDAFGYDFALQEMRHYTSLPRIFGGDAMRMYDRRTVPYQQLIAEKIAGTQNVIEVPYRFCSDEYDGALSWCSTYDEGADPYEIVQNAANNYENYYIFNAFARDRQDLDPWGHMETVFWRYFFPMQNQYQHWVYNAWDYGGLWDYLLEDPNYWQIENRPYDEAVDGGLSGAFGSRTALNALAKVVQAPEPGAYWYDPDDGLYYNYSYDTNIPVCADFDCADLSVPLGTGKYAFSLYDAPSGYYFYDRLHVAGSFYDKLAAIETLTSPETNFLGVDFDANITQYAISMHLMFPDEVTRLVGGSAVEEYKGYAGYAGPGGVFQYRDMFTPTPASAATELVDPATSFTIELYSAWLGMAFLNANFDNSFNDLMRVYIEGSGEGLTPNAAPERIARFIHPRTGRTFVAIRHEDPTVFSPAFETVQRAQSYIDNPWEDPGLQEYYVESIVSILETMRGLQELYGKLYF